VKQATALVAAGKERAGGPVGTESGFAASQMGRFQGGAGVNDLSQADNVATLHALVKIVEGLERERGRKTVLFFTEGFTIPPGYEHVFSDLLSRANRANVSFYGIDVRGLQLSTQLGSSGEALSQTAAISAQQRLSGSGDSTPVTREEATQDDTLQTSFRSDVVATLSQLSSGTGGFVVTQTNDFSRPLLRIAEDSRSYYEAFYAPSTAPVPGQFRRIEVRVGRKDVRVQSRSGYYVATASLVAAFAGKELPDEFEVRSAFYRFDRQSDGPFDCVLKLEASLDKAEFRPDADKGRLSGRVVLAGRVLDMRGEVVDTFGQDVGLGGTPEQVEKVRGQVLPLARRLRLRPGAYTIEVLVRDAVGNHASGRRVTATVPSPEGGLAMSSLVLVSGVEPADPKSDPTDPLRVGDQRIVPNVSHYVGAGTATLPVYYVVYLAPGSKDAVTATVEVTRDGKALARGQAPLPAPDALGRVVGLSPIPVQKLPPGTYEVRVTVASGGHETEEKTTITVVS
jgi:VWFA-related protein